MQNHLDGYKSQKRLRELLSNSVLGRTLSFLNDESTRIELSRSRQIYTYVLPVL
jgi:hypothetical protein